MYKFKKVRDRGLEAIKREKQIKASSRNKKIKLIESINLEWEDLYNEIVG